MSHKRKREAQTDDAEQDDSAVSSSKRAKVEKFEHPSAAERRQKRSERKSKKAQVAREGALKNKKAKLEVAASMPEFVKADSTTTKDLMTDDFIPLGDVPPAATSTQDGSTQVPKLSKKDQRREEKKQKTKEKEKNKDKVRDPSQPTDGVRPKRTSPRNIRKAAKAEKARAAVVDEYGPEALAATVPEGSNAIPIDNQSKPSQTPRFICFVGNLPFDCTLEQLQQHFRVLNPSQIRHATDKETGKSKGFAFLEFDHYDKMKTCLKVYHHSLFDPKRTAQLPDEAFDEDGKEIRRGNTKKMRGRRINVELTAGGGGASQNRKEKISKKNKKLSEQRARRKLAEMKAAKKAERKAGEQAKTEAPVSQDNAAIHPSRLSKMRM